MPTIDEETFANVVRTARFFVRAPPGQSVQIAVLEAAVRKAVGQLLEHSPADVQDLYVAEGCRQVAEGFLVQIADEKMVVGDNGPRVDWYVGDRTTNRPYWDRYRRFLSHELRFDDATVASVDRATDRIVQRLGDPRSDQPFDRRGLVVGQVQSGKTTSYAALINKAIDAGYQVVVVLTGIHESLRVQTQKRLEEGVRGIATDSGREGGVRNGAPLPIAAKPVPDPPHLFTTRAIGGDFTAAAAHFANAVSGTHMFAVKKNVTILRLLKEHFEQPAYRGRSLLVIDDEADNASVDVNKPDPTDKEHDPTAINRAIRKLLIQFEKRAYVGYTATPYANILIHRDNEANEVGKDLFPDDFIVMLAAPSNYVGPAAFFGGSTTQSLGDTSQVTPPLLRFVTDCGTAEPTDWMPKKHKKEHVPLVGSVAGLPLSLENAVMAFVTATAVRHFRGWDASHNSMLVHVSRFTKVQERVQQAIQTFVERLRGALSVEGSDAPLVDRFRSLYETDFLATTAKMDAGDRGNLPATEVLVAKARAVLDRLHVLTVNAEAVTSLDYDGYPGGFNVICVGGDKLSRGLTLEGLTVSYFLRASRMYDTLMQMGRWFGYRPGYKDLCRLYLTKEIGRWYQHVARADEELRGEFLTLEEEGRRPSDFGLRVRSHPTLMVTAPAKMNAAEEFSLVFGGRVSQTIQFFRDRENLQHNADATREFLGRIEAYAEGEGSLVRRDPSTGAPTGAQPLPGRLYAGVAVEEIKRFIGQYRFHPEALTVSAPKLLEFLERLNATRVATTWSVVVASQGEDDAGTRVSIATGVTVVPVRRATKPASDPVWKDELRSETINLGVLASPTDLIADLRPGEVERLRSIPKGRIRTDPAEGEHASRNRACKARDANHCLLVLYVVQPMVVSRGADGRPLRENVGLAPGCPLPIGIAIALPANERMPSVSYVVNAVLSAELDDQTEEAA
jgi:hypothetical protein